MQKIIFICILLSQTVMGQKETIHRIDARVYADSTGPGILVHDMVIDFKFAGYGTYSAGNYPTLSAFPLENGEHIDFKNISTARLRPKRVFWKKYIDPSARQQYDKVDQDGYYRWSDVEVEVDLVDIQGLHVHNRIKRPDYSDVFLDGTTDRGDFQLQLDQENNKTVVIEFISTFMKQCVNNPAHLFNQPDWHYCPICGGRLVKVEKPR